MNTLGQTISGYITLILLFLAAWIPAVKAQEVPTVSATNKITNFPVKEYFDNAQIHSITIDSRGLVYFAVANGIAEFDGFEWRMISIPNNAEINALAKNKDGRIYGAGNNAAGYLYVDEKGNTKFESILDSSSTFSDIIIEVLPAGNRIYFVGLHSISVYENNQLLTIAKGGFLSAALLNKTLVVSDQEHGLQFLNTQDQLQPIDGAIHTRSSNMKAISEGSILLATRSSGLHLLSIKNSNVELKPWESEVNDRSKGVTFSSIDLISERVIAFGTFEQGVILSDYSGKIISHYTKESGLLNNNIFDVLFTQKSSLWVGLNEGVSLIKIPIEISGVPTSTALISSATDEPLGGQESPPWFIKLYQGTIGSWFFAPKVDSSKNSSFLNSAETFASIIRRVEYIPNDSVIFGGAFSQTQHGVQVLDQTDSAKYEFDYDFNAFRFSYSTNDYDKIEGLQFQVKLEGMDRDWSTWSQNTYREYTNLSWGDYSFIVQAQNVNNTLSRPATFSFRISPPWYESNWFYLLQFLVIMAALVVSGILNKTGKAISLSEALIAIVVIIIFRYLEFYIEPYLDEYSNDIALFKIGISIVFGFSLEFIEELFHKTVAKLTGLEKMVDTSHNLNESTSKNT